MARTRFDGIVLPVVLAAGLAGLAGCAGQPSNGLEIVEWQQQERARLEAQGFPAYGPPGG
jgi:predicted oxidoreductase